MPLHVEHTSERVGLVMMIFLGECIAAILLQPLAKTAAQYVGIALSAIIVWSLHLLYYHTHPEPDDHALRIKVWRGISWNYLHWLLGMGFLLTGAGLKIVLQAYVPVKYGGTDGMLAEGAWILCICYAASLHIMTLIRSAHYMKFDLDNEKNVYNIGAKLGINHLFITWWSVAYLWPIPSESLRPLHARKLPPVSSVAGACDAVCASCLITLCHCVDTRRTCLCFPAWTGRKVHAAVLIIAIVCSGMCAVLTLFCCLHNAVYFVPFGRETLGATGTLVVLAVHGLLLNFIETAITHTVESNPGWQELQRRAEEEHEAKRKSMSGRHSLDNKTAHMIEGEPQDPDAV